MKSINENAAMNAAMNVNENNIDGKLNTKKRKPIPPMWRVLGKARKIFDAQLSKTNEVKLLCITNFMNAETQDADKFWGDYFEQVANLLDSRRYTAECKRFEYDPANMAEHIVFLGSTIINKVLKNGIYNTLGNDMVLYKDRLSPMDTDKYRDQVTAFMGKVAKTA